MSTTLSRSHSISQTAHSIHSNTTQQAPADTSFTVLPPTASPSPQPAAPFDEIIRFLEDNALARAQDLAERKHIAIQLGELSSFLRKSRQDNERRVDELADQVSAMHRQFWEIARGNARVQPTVIQPVAAPAPVVEIPPPIIPTKPAEADTVPIRPPRPPSPSLNFKVPQTPNISIQPPTPPKEDARPTVVPPNPPSPPPPIVVPQLPTEDYPQPIQYSLPNESTIPIRPRTPRSPKAQPVVIPSANLASIRAVRPSSPIFPVRTERIIPRNPSPPIVPTRPTNTATTSSGTQSPPLVPMTPPSAGLPEPVVVPMTQRQSSTRSARSHPAEDESRIPIIPALPVNPPPPTQKVYVIPRATAREPIIPQVRRPQSPDTVPSSPILPVYTPPIVPRAPISRRHQTPRRIPDLLPIIPESGRSSKTSPDLEMASPPPPIVPIQMPPFTPQSRRVPIPDRRADKPIIPRPPLDRPIIPGSYPASHGPIIPNTQADTSTVPIVPNQPRPRRRSSSRSTRSPPSVDEEQPVLPQTTSDRSEGRPRMHSRTRSGSSSIASLPLPPPPLPRSLMRFPARIPTPSGTTNSSSRRAWRRESKGRDEPIVPVSGFTTSSGVIIPEPQPIPVAGAPEAAFSSPSIPEDMPVPRQEPDSPPATLRAKRKIFPSFGLRRGSSKAGGS